jgi:hypothetical protein
VPGKQQTELKRTEGQQAQLTPIDDVVFDLVSAVYHALQNASSCSIYAGDAQLAGELQLARFFWQKQQEEGEAASTAGELLSRLLSGGQAVQQQAHMELPSRFRGQSYQGQSGSGFASRFQGGQGNYLGRLANFSWQATGAPDVTYDLVSLLYHSLEAAQRCKTSIQNAQQAGQNYQHIVQFYQKLYREEADAANRAKRLLAPRLPRSAATDPLSRPSDNGGGSGDGNGGDEHEQVTQPTVSGGEAQSEEFPQYQAGGYPGGLSQNWQYEGGTVAGGIGQPGTPQGGAGPGGEETGGTVAAGLGIGPDLVGGTGTGGTSPGSEVSPEETP